MPGILPMKVIKVGTCAQSRIAQACDRCRSKKIRCDGVTPCCSQCSNVGFECKTSDKLSRRAFPRGYTESLEERVRDLEKEVRELKDLLDEKDEKIDLLSKIHSFASPRRPSTLADASPEAPSPGASTTEAKEEVFQVKQSPFLLESDQKADSYFMGASSGRSFVDSFKTKIHESGKSANNFSTKALFGTCNLAKASPRASTTFKLPPRLVADQMINIFFQEWAPLFPVLHRPSFLKLYAEFVADPESVKDQQFVAQLYFVFAIAALSSESDKQDIQSFELQGQAALQSVISENTFGTLQCLVLAQIYCINRADYKKLLSYSGVAVNLSYRLGLHQSQKRFSLGALTRESRKKVFWTLYTLDCFSAALLGLPRLLRDDDIHTEDPADVDDENLTERGFQPSLPGESTRLSSALALFRAARVLAKVLTEVYPAATSHELSLQKIAVLSDELNEWRNNLAPDLRLCFVQDKPSTNVVSSRSPLLSLTYYYIRTLIHRPVVCSNLGSKASSSIVAMADSSKHIIQIVQLLEERRMSFSFCLNKNELLILSGFGLLFRGLELKEEGKLIKDSQRLAITVVELLERNNAPGASSFRKIASAMVPIDPLTKVATIVHNDAVSRRVSHDSMPAPSILKNGKKQLQAISSCFSFGTRSIKDEFPPSRRSTMANLPVGNLALYARAGSQASISSVQSEPTARRPISVSMTRPIQPVSSLLNCQTNLDYLSFTQDNATDMNNQTSTVFDWGHDLGQIDGDTPFPYEQAMNQISADALGSYVDVSPSLATQDWSPESWGIQDSVSQNSAKAQSVFSLSEESLNSGEDSSNYDFGTEYRGYIMPNLVADDYHGIDLLDGGYRL